MKSFLPFFLLLAIPLAAQQPAQPAPKPVPPNSALTKKIWAAMAAGAAAGALVGAKGLSFASLPASTRGAHEWRAGAVYGAIGGVLAGAIAARLTPAATPLGSKPFLSKSNLPWLAGIVTVHVLDYTSTRYFRDRNKDEWLLTNALVDNKTKFIATETAAAAAGIGLMYLLHRTGHDQLAHWIAAGYISFGVASAVANYRYPTTGHGLFGN